MRILQHGPVPDGADLKSFFHIAPAKAGAPALVVCNSLLIPHAATPAKRVTNKQSAAHCRAPRKVNGDLLVSGKAYSNFAEYGHGKAVRIAVEVPARRWRKELAVFGDRVWMPGIAGSTASEPRSFESIPVTYEYAHGGQGFAWNPLGLGIGPGERGLRLPNIEFVERPITSPSSLPGAASFAPIDPSWRPRSDRLGTFNANWLSHYWPGMPPDFDPSYWNEAPADQQFPSGFRGDETITVLNMHANLKRFEHTLPGRVCRAFIKKADGHFIEIPMMLDTVSIDMEAGHTELVWRGASAVSSAKLRDVAFLFALLEPIKALTSHAACEALFEAERRIKHPTEDELAELAAQKRQIQADEDAKRKEKSDREVRDIFEKLKQQKAENAEILKSAAAAAGVSLPEKAKPLPPASPHPVVASAAEPWTRERVTRMLAGNKPSFVAADLSSLDLIGLDLAGADFTAARLTGTWLQGANLSKANLSTASAAGANFSGADLRGATLTGATLAGAFFTKSNITNTSFAGLDLTGLNFEQTIAHGASFSRAKLAGANFRLANLEKADFYKADIASALFDDAILTKASFLQASGPGASFLRCAMGNFRATEADFRHGKFAGIQAASSVWRRARLEDAIFSRATLTRANFSETDLARANFDRALLENADFGEAVLPNAVVTNAKLLRSCFDGANLQATDLSGSNLYMAGFFRATMAGIKLEGSLLTGTVLAS